LSVIFVSLISILTVFCVIFVSSFVLFSQAAIDWISSWWWVSPKTD